MGRSLAGTGQTLWSELTSVRECAQRRPAQPCHVCKHGHVGTRVCRCQREKAAQERRAWVGPGLCLRSLLGQRGACGTEATGRACLPGSVWGTLLLTTLFPVLTHVDILKQKKLLGPHENQQVCWDPNPPPAACPGDMGCSLALGSCPSPSRPRTDTLSFVSPASGWSPR